MIQGTVRNAAGAVIAENAVVTLYDLEGNYVAYIEEYENALKMDNENGPKKGETITKTSDQGEPVTVSLSLPKGGGVIKLNGSEVSSTFEIDPPDAPGEYPYDYEIYRFGIDGKSLCLEKKGKIIRPVREP